MRHQVQPRVCGEYSSKIQCVRSMAGSTPRMRGIWNAKKELRNIIRFNPAYAGNMVYQWCMCVGNEVQPRVCGEYAESFRDSLRVSGSTPRMRGIL